jgi:chromate transporter
MTPPDDMPAPASAPASPAEVFWAFLKLGLSAFGGPSAHIGYFRAAFVERRRWLDDRRFSDLLALSQLLPGPASSQLGMALGLERAGGLGALAAWVGFTLPSALAMILLGYGMARWQGLAESGLLHGLKIAAVAVVAHAVLSMATSLCRGWVRATTAIGAAALVLAMPGMPAQWLAIVLGAVVGRLLVQRQSLTPVALHGGGLSRRAGSLALVTFALLLVVLPWLAAWSASPLVQAVAVFYQAGALVFGGGHVVLPLLQAGVVGPGWVSQEAFLAGYGAAQALPGPLFAFAAYLGTLLPAPLGGWGSGLLMLLAIFLPGALLIVGAMPFWDQLRRQPAVQQSLAGINAAVVGLLAAALYRPIWTSTIASAGDLLLAGLAFGLLVSGRVRPLLVVALSAAGGWALS